MCFNFVAVICPLRISNPVCMMKARLRLASWVGSASMHVCQMCSLVTVPYMLLLAGHTIYTTSFVCTHQVVGQQQASFSFSSQQHKFLARLGLLLSSPSPRSVPSLLELHHFFLLLPRPHTYRRLSLDRVRAAQASHRRMRQARTHARVPSSPSLSLPISGPAAAPAPACVRRAATATSIKDQQCASSISPSLSAVYSCRPI